MTITAKRITDVTENLNHLLSALQGTLLYGEQSAFILFPALISALADISKLGDEFLELSPEEQDAKLKELEKEFKALKYSLDLAYLLANDFWLMREKSAKASNMKEEEADVRARHMRSFAEAMFRRSSLETDFHPQGKITALTRKMSEFVYETQVADITNQLRLYYAQRSQSPVKYKLKDKLYYDPANPESIAGRLNATAEVESLLRHSINEQGIVDVKAYKVALRAICANIEKIPNYYSSNRAPSKGAPIRNYRYSKLETILINARDTLSTTFKDVPSIQGEVSAIMNQHMNNMLAKSLREYAKDRSSSIKSFFKYGLKDWIRIGSTDENSRDVRVTNANKLAVRLQTCTSLPEYIAYLKESTQQINKITDAGSELRRRLIISQQVILNELISNGSVPNEEIRQQLLNTAHPVVAKKGIQVSSASKIPQNNTVSYIEERIKKSAKNKKETGQPIPAAKNVTSIESYARDNEAKTFEKIASIKFAEKEGEEPVNREVNSKLVIVGADRSTVRAPQGYKIAEVAGNYLPIDQRLLFVKENSSLTLAKVDYFITAEGEKIIPGGKILLADGKPVYASTGKGASVLVTVKDGNKPIAALIADDIRKRFLDEFKGQTQNRILAHKTLASGKIKHEPGLRSRLAFSLYFMSIPVGPTMMASWGPTALGVILDASEASDNAKTDKQVGKIDLLKVAELSKRIAEKIVGKYAHQLQQVYISVNNQKALEKIVGDTVDRIIANIEAGSDLAMNFTKADKEQYEKLSANLSKIKKDFIDKLSTLNQEGKFNEIIELLRNEHDTRNINEQFDEVAEHLKEAVPEKDALEILDALQKEIEAWEKQASDFLMDKYADSAVASLSASSRMSGQYVTHHKDDFTLITSEGYNTHDIFVQPGIVVLDKDGVLKFFARDGQKPEKYGYRFGTMDEVKAMNISHAGHVVSEECYDYYKKLYVKTYKDNAKITAFDQIPAPAAQILEPTPVEIMKDKENLDQALVLKRQIVVIDEYNQLEFYASPGHQPDPTKYEFGYKNQTETFELKAHPVTKETYDNYRELYYDAHHVAQSKIKRSDEIPAYMAKAHEKGQQDIVNTDKQENVVQTVNIEDTNQQSNQDDSFDKYIDFIQGKLQVISQLISSNKELMDDMKESHVGFQQLNEELQQLVAIQKELESALVSLKQKQIQAVDVMTRAIRLYEQRMNSKPVYVEQKSLDTTISQQPITVNSKA